MHHIKVDLLFTKVSFVLKLMEVNISSTNKHDLAIAFNCTGFDTSSPLGVTVTPNTGGLGVSHKQTKKTLKRRVRW